MTKAKGIIFLAISGLLLAAALVLILTNIGDSWELHFYWQTVVVRRGWMLLTSAVVGAAIWAVWRRCVPAGLRALRDAKRKGIAKATEQRIKALEKTPPKP